MMYSKRKLFIFHNEKVVTHIESQPNQSRYIESLIMNSINTKPDTSDIIDFLKQYLNSPTTEQPKQTQFEISNSISNILNLV